MKIWMATRLTARKPAEQGRVAGKINQLTPSCRISVLTLQPRFTLPCTRGQAPTSPFKIFFSATKSRTGTFYSASSIKFDVVLYCSATASQHRADGTDAAVRCASNHKIQGTIIQILLECHSQECIMISLFCSFVSQNKTLLLFLGSVQYLSFLDRWFLVSRVP